MVCFFVIAKQVLSKISREIAILIFYLGYFFPEILGNTV
jgi:hypothetical protein